MKRFIIFILCIAVIAIGAYFVIDKKQLVDLEDFKQLTKESLPKIKSKQEEKEVLPFFEGDLFSYIGEESDKLIDDLGDPDRKDMSAYGYTWWVYTDGESTYMQFGIEDDEVVTIFASGEDVLADPISIGDSYEEVNEAFNFEDEIEYKDDLSFYKFLMSDEDLQTNPLVKVSDDVFVSAYFDTFTDELSSVRIMTGDTLLQQRIYEIEYRGSLPDPIELSDDEWEKVESGMEKQIFDLSNIYRHRFGVGSLKADKEVQEVAYLHSKDMQDNEYFSHYAEDGSGLKERLQEKNIYYMTAGENIAAQHTDAPAAMEGWLNSEGHREALLNEEYTHIGVGVYRLYYTQNFLFKP